MTGWRVTTVLHLSCLYAVIWGLFILNPYTYTFGTQPALWRPMAQLAPEWCWGLFMIGSGVAAFLLSRYWRKWAGPFVMALQFISLAVLFFMGDVERPGWALIGLLAVFNFLQFRAFWRAEGWNG